MKTILTLYSFLAYYETFGQSGAEMMPAESFAGRMKPVSRVAGEILPGQTTGGPVGC